MTKTQKITFSLIFVVGLFYFGIFFIPNSYGGRDWNILMQSSPDEYVTYPNVIRILTPGETFNDTRANLFLYEDYHYGYPFYAYSAIVLLPVRLIFGADFTENMQLNLLLLRQFVNVLPMTLAAGLLVFMQTRFESKIKSLALFVFLLSIRGVFRSHIWWWHPDSITVLFAVLTLFFLDKDRLRFGKYFYLAAVACGLATATKLLGVFFFLTIPVYLLIGLVKSKLRIGKALGVSALFILVMVVVVVGSNPFLFSDEQRERMIMIQETKKEELAHGYTHDDPTYYQKGARWWVSTLEKWYAPPWILGFVVASMIAGCIWGKRRLLNVLILTWVIPYSVYVLYFVAVKPDHYWLPVMLPLFSCSFFIIDSLIERTGLSSNISFRNLSWRHAVIGLCSLVLIGQFVYHLIRPVSGNIPIYQNAILVGMEQIRTNP